MKPTELHVIILAAGEGKRMRSALPKVLLPLAGRPMLAHVLAAADALSPSAIHVVHGHGGDAVQAAFNERSDLRWVHQPEQHGTGHAVQLALPGIPDDARILVLYGDVPLLRSETLDLLITVQAAPLVVLTIYAENPHGYGRIVCDGEGRVRAIVEERDANAEQRRIKTVNTGIVAARAGELRRWLQAVRPDNAQGELYLTDVFALAAAEGLAALPIPCADAEQAQGANDPWQLAQLERLYQRRAVRQLCLSGVRVADPARLDLRGELHCGSDVSVDLDVIFEGRCTLGSGVSIGPFVRLKDCQLADGTIVLGHCDLEGVRTTGACRIGPFARLRPGAELAAGAQIGNFVELKNASLGAGSKAGHLAYVGDAEIGERVNISAGVITCNYDGAHKHRTTVGDGAFIGSDSQLIAPVTIASGAYIAAGSTISKDAPADALTICRAREQRTLDGWKRPKK
jgi:bifunctional UDP-N-acetylglucosamine pyrophosphorylase/glucosamine-1-phosphate N-acetyltransferase